MDDSDVSGTTIRRGPEEYKGGLLVSYKSYRADDAPLGGKVFEYTRKNLSTSSCTTARLGILQGNRFRDTTCLAQSRRALA
jgi:hypothetical protein